VRWPQESPFSLIDGSVFFFSSLNVVTMHAVLVLGTA